MCEEKKVWQTFNREEIETIVQGNIRAVEDKMGQMLELFLTSGYYLRRQRQEEMYKEAGFARFEDYVRAVYGKSKSWASRMMKINERYSLEGDSPLIDPQYKGYGVSQLQEMLYLTEEQKEQVTPEMTVKEIRAAGREEKPEEGPLSFFGLPKTVRPEGSRIATPGCGDGKHACFLCSRACGIRQEERRCRTAPCGNPFPCSMMGKKQEIETGLYRDECQHLHAELAPVCAGSREPDPCCLTCEHKTCPNRCDVATKRDEEECRKEQEEVRNQQKKSGDRKPALRDKKPAGEENPGRDEEAEAMCCESAAEGPERVSRDPEKEKPVATSQQANEDFSGDEDNPDEIGSSVPVTPQEVLKEEKKKLSEYRKAFEGEAHIPAFIEKQEIVVEALAAFVCDRETEETLNGVECEDFPLPDFKNNDQRKAWLRDYKAWGLWYEDKHIGAKYYRYRFRNGAELIAEAYEREKEDYLPEREESYLHLVGGPEPAKNHHTGGSKWSCHKAYSKYPNSETELVEFLKEVQKWDDSRKKTRMGTGV